MKEKHKSAKEQHQKLGIMEIHSLNKKEVIEFEKMLEKLSKEQPIIILGSRPKKSWFCKLKNKLRRWFK